MNEMSVFWLRAAVALYAVGLLHALWTVLARRTHMFGAAFAAFSTATVLHMVSLAERWRLAGHFPVDNFFETASLCAFLIAVGFLFFNWRYGFRSLGVFLFPLVFIMALAGSMGEPVETWTNPRVRDAWLVAHIVFVLTGYAALLLTAVASVFYLIEERQLKRKLTGRLFDRLPPLGTIDTMINRAMGVGFLLITLATVTGSMWAFIESGTGWIAEGRVAIALATWLLWLVMVFLRTAAGWRGRRTAVMALAIVGCSAVTWAAHVGLRPVLMR